MTRIATLLMICFAISIPTQGFAKPANSCKPKDICKAQCQSLLSSPQYGKGTGKVVDADCLDDQNRCCPGNDPRWNICACVIEIDGKCIGTTNNQQVSCETKAKALPRVGCYCSTGTTSRIPLSLGLVLLFFLCQRRTKELG